MSEHTPPPRRMADYVWFRIPGRLPELPAPFFLGRGLAKKPGYATHRVKQPDLPGRMTLMLALSPGGQGCVNGQTRALKPGHAMFTWADNDQNWFGYHPQHRGSFEYLGLIFDGDFAVRGAHALRERYSGPYQLDTHASVIRRLVGLTKEKSHNVMLSASEGMGLICDMLTLVLGAAEADVRAPQTRQLAEMAEAAMRGNPARDWTVSVLADQFGVSREHLTRAFTQKYGVPPRRYLSELRIQEACSRLRNSNDPIKAIMLDLGFTSHATFTRAFRRYTSRTPTEYRAAQGL